MKKSNTTQEEKAKRWRAEYEAIIDNGISISITERYVRRRFVLFGAERSVERVHRFEIHQPTLGVLDLINYYLRDVQIDEAVIKEAGDVYPEVRAIEQRHCYDVARAMAVAILGNGSVVKVLGKYKRNEKAIEKMAGLLMRCLTPSKLMEMASSVNVMSNLSDFLNSIRLLKVAPDRIETEE